MAETKISIIQQVARNCRDLIVDSVPASYSGSSIDIAKLIHPRVGQLKGKFLYIYSGSLAGVDRVITGFEPANNRVSFDQVFGSLPGDADQMIITDFWEYSEYSNMLNQAMRIARNHFLQDVSATLDMVATQSEYPVPSGMEYVNSLRVVPSGNTNYAADSYASSVFVIEPRMFRIEKTPVGSSVIVIDPRQVELSTFDDSWFRVMGQAKPSILENDSDVVPDDLEAYLIARTTMLISEQRAVENKFWSTKFKTYALMTSDLEEYIYRNAYGKRVGA